MILVIKAEVDWLDGRPQEALNATFSSFVLTMSDYLSYQPGFCVFFSCIFCQLSMSLVISILVQSIACEDLSRNYLLCARGGPTGPTLSTTHSLTGFINPHLCRLSLRRRCCCCFCLTSWTCLMDACRDVNSFVVLVTSLFTHSEQTSVEHNPSSACLPLYIHL